MLLKSIETNTWGPKKLFSVPGIPMPNQVSQNTSKCGLPIEPRDRFYVVYNSVWIVCNLTHIKTWQKNGLKTPEKIRPKSSGSNDSEFGLSQPQLAAEVFELCVTLPDGWNVVVGSVLFLIFIDSIMWMDSGNSSALLVKIEGFCPNSTATPIQEDVWFLLLPTKLHPAPACASPPVARRRCVGNTWDPPPGVGWRPGWENLPKPWENSGKTIP